MSSPALLSLGSGDCAKSAAQTLKGISSPCGGRKFAVCMIKVVGEAFSRMKVRFIREALIAAER